MFANAAGSASLRRLAEDFVRLLPGCYPGEQRLVGALKSGFYFVVLLA